MDILILPVGIIVIAVLAAGARLSIADEDITLREAVSSLIIAVFMAVAIYPYLLETGLGHGQRVLTIALCTFMSRDLLNILIVLQHQIKRDPLGIVREFLNWRKSKND